jgi:SRSO17 transposase
MTPQQLKALDHRLTSFLEELLAPMGRSERRHWARTYVEGLLLDGERKSMEPMASRLSADVQALRQFVGQSPWAVEAVQRQLALKVVDLISSPEVWILDDTSFPKAGQHSVGVSRQYCGALGKVANCQVAVTLHWSSGEASCPLGWRLFVPQQWFADAKRAAAVKLPPDLTFRSKPELACELLDQLLGWGVPPLPLVTDSFYGDSYNFRQQLQQRQLEYVVAVEPDTQVWTQNPQTSWPAPQGRGRPRQGPPPQPQDLLTVARQLPASAWRHVTWREGSRGSQRSRFAKLPVWAAHGWRSGPRTPRVAEWLLIAWPIGEPQPTKYWLAQLGAAEPGLRRLVRMAQARWRIELDYRELKEELGLDHFEGRHWLGWHHHVTLVTLAYAFLRAEQARLKKNDWCDLTPGPAEDAAAAD